MNRTKVDNVNKEPVKDSDAVFESIHTIMHLFRAEQYRSLRDGPHDLTHMEGKMLGYFARHPGHTLRDLVGHTRQDKGQLARLVKTLREQGLLEAREDQADRRSVQLHLTPARRAVHQTLRRRTTQLSEVAVRGLTATDRRQLVALLQRIRTNLEPASKN